MAHGALRGAGAAVRTDSRRPAGGVGVPIEGLKVTYLITRADTLGGAQVHVLQLSQALAQAGGNPRILIGEGTVLLPRIEQAGIPCTVLPQLRQAIGPLADLAALRAIRQALAADPPDLLSCHSSKAGILGRIAARTLGIPTIFTAHGWSFADGVPALPRAVYREIERAMAPLAARIITVSEADRRLAMRSRVAGPRRMVTVHNGAPDLEEHLRARPATNPCRILCVARLEPQKRIGLLLETLARLSEQDWELTVVGDGRLREDLMATAAELELDERVEFLGFTDDVPELMSAHELLVLPSDWEGFPRIIIEAMRSGLPVIASDVGGVAEAVDDGVSGYVVARNTVEQWQERLEQMLGSAELRAEMGNAGRARYEQEFTLERMIEQTFALYRSLVPAAHTP